MYLMILQKYLKDMKTTPRMNTKQIKPKKNSIALVFTLNFSYFKQIIVIQNQNNCNKYFSYFNSQAFANKNLEIKINKYLQKHNAYWQQQYHCEKKPKKNIKAQGN